MRRYLKALAQVASAAALALIAALSGDDVVDWSEWINVALAALLILPVWYAENDPARAPIAKAVVALVAPLFVLASSLITDGFTTGELLQLLAAAAGALLVYVARNRDPHRVVGL